MNDSFIALLIFSGNEKYSVVNLVLETSLPLISKQFYKHYVKISDSTYKRLKPDVFQGNIVLLKFEDFPEKDDSLVSYKSFEIYRSGDLQFEKLRLINKIQQKNFNADSNVVTQLDLFEFMVGFANLANEGYFITNDNREEKYLEILSTNNENLLTKLEKYLDAKDKFDDLNRRNRKVQNVKKQIEQATTVEELKEIEEKEQI